MPKRYKLLKEMPGFYEGEVLKIGTEVKWDRLASKYVPDGCELIQFDENYCEFHPTFFEVIDIKYTPKKGQKYYFLKIDYGHIYIDEDQWSEEYRHRRRRELGIVFRTLTQAKAFQRELENLIEHYHNQIGE